MTDNNMDILALLKDTMRKKIISARQQAGLSVSELADKCGWEENYLMLMEQGKVEITPEILARVLDSTKYFQE